MENLEILKGVVSDETYAAIEAETKDSKIKLMDLSAGQYVSEDKYKDLEIQLDRVNSALADKTAEYDSLKSKAGDNAELKNEIERLKTEHADTINGLKTDYAKQLKRSAVINEIERKYHPKDVTDIMPHIDMEKISIDNDNVVGLTEQMTPLTESKAYLFGEQSNPKKSGLNHNGSEINDAALRASFGLKKKE